MEANKKLNAALNAVFNSEEYNELHRVVMELREMNRISMRESRELEKRVKFAKYEY